MTTSPTSEPCPACGATLIPVLYGLQSGEDVMDAYGRGEIALGGCNPFEGGAVVCRGPVHHEWDVDSDGRLIPPRHYGV